MSIKPFNELTIYKYRYFVGYSILAILGSGLLFLNFNSLPAGLSAAEQASATASSQINFSFKVGSFLPDMLYFLQHTSAVDLPYHLVQKVSLNFLGISPLGVRLPSMFFAAVSVALVFGLLNRWLKTNSAIMAGIIFASTSWFLSIGRSGTPDIMVVFWTATFLLLATLISQSSSKITLWKMLGLICLGISSYSPYTVYLFVAGGIAVFTQPHLRCVIKNTGKKTYLLSVVLLLFIIAPLLFNIYRQPSIILQLLAVPKNLPGPADFINNLLLSLSDLFNPLAIGFGNSPLPLLTIPIIVFALIGLGCLLHDWHSVRSHTLLFWVALLIPVIGLDISRNLVVMLVPIILLSGIGLQKLINYWYTTFPNNPYARVFGLLPLSILLFSIVGVNYQRYFIAMPYAETKTIYNQDAFLLQNTVSQKAYRNQKLIVIVSKKDLTFYSIMEKSVPNLKVLTTDTIPELTGVKRLIVAESELPVLISSLPANFPKDKVEFLVTAQTDQALRFRVFSQP